MGTNLGDVPVRRHDWIRGSRRTPSTSRGNGAGFSTLPSFRPVSWHLHEPGTRPSRTARRAFAVASLSEPGMPETVGAPRRDFDWLTCPVAVP